MYLLNTKYIHFNKLKYNLHKLYFILHSNSYILFNQMIYMFYVVKFKTMNILINIHILPQQIKNKNKCIYLKKLSV